MSGSKSFYNFYRDSSGHLCAKLDKIGTSYTEGRVALYYGLHSGAPNGVYITDVVANNTTSNIF